MRFKTKLAVVGTGVLALGGGVLGVGVATMGASAATRPPVNAKLDVQTTTDVAGSSVAEAPGGPQVGADVQSGDQSTVDVPGAPAETPESTTKEADGPGGPQVGPDVQSGDQSTVDVPGAPAEAAGGAQ
jgi:hypothetical protein